MQGIKPKPIGNALLPYGTPIHVRDLMVMLLKETFASFPENYPYRFVEGDFQATGILFDVPLNKESEIYGKKPVVIIERGPQQAQILATGDLASAHMPSYSKMGTILTQSSLSLLVLSKIKGECEIISQIIYGMLFGSRILLPSVLGVHFIDGISLSQVARFDQDDMMFAATVSFSFSMQMKWTLTAQNPLLAAINTHIRKVTDTNNI